MKNRMIWGLAILIIVIIGVSVFLLTRTTETEPETVYNPLTEADKKQVEQNIQDAIDKEKQNLPPIVEGDKQQVEIEKPKTTEKPVTVPRNTGEAETPYAHPKVGSIPMSPFGFGSYPEVPEGMLDLGGNPYKPIWAHHRWPNIRMAKTHELLSRVKIKLWQKGERDWVGMGGDENKIYVNYPNTVYVTWKDSKDDKGNPIRIITTLSGDPDACLRIKSNTIARLGRYGTPIEADIPSDVEVILHSESGIDPYKFLNLPR